jgi:hypothetical protein
MIDRAKTLARVTRECLAVHEPCTWANLSALMSPEERAAFRGRAVLADTAESITDGNTAPPASIPEEPQPARQPVRPSGNPYDRMRAAEHDLNVARQELRNCRTALMSARLAFGIALQTWNNGAPVATHEQAAREFIATSNAARAARAAANPDGVWHPGITRTARALAGGNQRRGGGAAFRRGAYTKAEALKIESERLRAAALAAKTPRG